MKKILIMLLAMLMIVSAAACSSGSGSGQSEEPETQEQEETKHKIAVVVYDRTDDEVISFKNYLENYIAPIFDVEFLYSDTLRTEDEIQKFISDASDNGAEGIMSFLSMDLKGEVELAADKGMYYMLASGTVTDEAYESVADSEYFLGVIGPGDEMEYTAGANLAAAALNLREGDEKDSYFVLSGGGANRNEMHRLRTVGLLERFEDAYGVKLEKSPEDIAASDEVTKIETDKFSLCVCPGYLVDDDVYNRSVEEYKAGDYDIVLGVLPVTKMLNEIKDARIGVVDCYSQTNQHLFNTGQMSYVTGKYSSMIGPSFAAMFNAITGHAEDFRDNGRAFRIKQGFWSSDSREDYDEKYSMASSIEKCAYNYADLQSIMKEYTPDATLDDLKSLAEAFKYEDAVARRAE